MSVSSLLSSTPIQHRAPAFQHAPSPRLAHYGIVTGVQKATSATS